MQSAETASPPPDIALVETHRRADGCHDLLLTVLANHAFPLLRYRIGDVVDAPLRTAPSGFSALGVIHGRDDDFLVTRRGSLIDSTAVEAVVQSASGVRAFRAHQTRDGAVALSVEGTAGGPEPDLDRLRSRLVALLEGQPVAVERVSGIPLTEAGKRRVVTSDLASAVGSGTQA